MRGWDLIQSTLEEVWGRLRELAADVLAGRWAERPGRLCGHCPVAECRHLTGIPDALGLGVAGSAGA